MERKVRRLAVLTTLLFTFCASEAFAQVRMVLVARWSYIFVTPYARPEALAQVEPGVVLSVLGESGGWFLVEYESRRLGRRRGYILKGDVSPIHAERATAEPAAKGVGTAPASIGGLEKTVPAPSGTVAVARRASKVESKESNATGRRATATPSVKADHPRWRAFGEGLALGLAAIAAGLAAAQPEGSSSSLSSSTKLMLFGGDGHRTYLGCLTCNRYEVDSVYNSYGTNGSRYATESIFNPYSDYGSRYSDHGACNPYAQDPPVIVDHQGAFYGRLTMNRYHHQRTHDPQLLAWLAGICSR